MNYGWFLNFRFVFPSLKKLQSDGCVRAHMGSVVYVHVYEEKRRKGEEEEIERERGEEERERGKKKRREK